MPSVDASTGIANITPPCTTRSTDTSKSVVLKSRGTSRNNPMRLRLVCSEDRAVAGCRAAAVKDAR
jgi:hypothetical protein